MAKVIQRNRARKKDQKFTPGRRAKIRFGGANPIKVEVIEDRGPIGYKGRRIVFVRRIDPWGDDTSTFEVPADELILTGK